ncbi:phosphatase PAP2 family protein [Chryseobacterium cheonjiense]|uniref:Phosphatase PAP2 family protein n=1 Tax=Chryseobacterium cheonjiense TaxID=2728845 RepID=A0A7Y0A407_9FLAO|nr:phosphatase PAP2 family protein [Chryseobacterium cheonjiense]NML56233.1 phosphatase PAP2 family protein [Chryseobacterium cheonjiense]
MKPPLITIFSALIFSYSLNGQIKADSSASAEQFKYQDRAYQPSYKKLIVPAVFIGYASISLTSDALKNLNRSTKYEIGEHQPRHIKLDNYTQYLPAVMVYGYNLAGIKGKHNFKDRTIIYGTSQVISAAFVLPLKHLVKEERPDGSNHLSFPSGHTTAAFSSAHFLFREYKDEHFWLSLSGYPIAIFTGVYRTLNDKHWVGDVVAGAGFGILSTELAYWLFPRISTLFNKKDSKSFTMIYPVADGKNFGAGMVLNF